MAGCGMAPMMGAMNPMMMNPMMNPMMACMMNPMMMGAMSMASSTTIGPSMTPPPGTKDPVNSSQTVNRAPGYVKGKGKRAPNAEGGEKAEVDPQIAELCKEFGIEDRIRNRLNEVMMTREGTFDTDMKELWEVCRTAKKPSGFLMVKIRELERGIFTGAGKLDRDIATFQMKHKLDDNALGKLLDVMQHRPTTKMADLREMEKHLRSASDPSGAVIAMCKQVSRGFPISNPTGDKRERSPRSRSRERRARSPSRSRSRGGGGGGRGGR